MVSPRRRSGKPKPTVKWSEAVKRLAGHWHEQRRETLNTDPPETKADQVDEADR